MNYKTNRLIICLVVLASFSTAAVAQESALSSMEKWQAVDQTEEILSFFENLFISIGIDITDTGERFTITHEGSHISFRDGFDADAVDYVVAIEAFQVDRLERYANTGDIAVEEQYRVMKEFFTPATASLLAYPDMARPSVKRFTRAEDLIHVRLKSPVPGEEDVTHTLIYANRQWLVIPGLHGTPERLYNLTLVDAISFQKAAYSTLQSDKMGRWLGFGRWYRQWRKGISETL